MAEREIRYVHHRSTPVDILPEEAVEAIRDATAEVLWRTGIQVRSDSLLAQLGAAGAVIDEEDSRARFPKDVQAGALATVPGDLPLASREPGLDLILDGTRGYLGVDGNAAEVVDLDTDLRRASTKADVAAGTRIGDALPQIGYVWQPAVSREMPVPSEPLHNLEANLNNTGKHIVMMTAVTPEQAVASAEMAAVAVGGEQALRDQPILSAFQCSVSPLVYDGGPLAAAVEFAKADVPSGFMVMPILGATSPITRAGTMVVNNAEVIGGVIAHQLLAPGRSHVLRERGHDDGPVVGRGQLRRTRGPRVPDVERPARARLRVEVDGGDVRDRIEDERLARRRRERAVGVRELDRAGSTWPAARVCSTRPACSAPRSSCWTPRFGT